MGKNEPRPRGLVIKGGGISGCKGVGIKFDDPNADLSITGMTFSDIDGGDIVADQVRNLSIKDCSFDRPVEKVTEKTRRYVSGFSFSKGDHLNNN
jgi:hypothetical protein